MYNKIISSSIVNGNGNDPTLYHDCYFSCRSLLSFFYFFFLILLFIQLNKNKKTYPTIIYT